MAGYSTNGLTAATLPFSGSEEVAFDTEKASGIAPQSVAVSVQQLSAVGLGSVQALTDGATIAVDLSQGSYFSVTLGGNRTFTFSNPSPGQVFDLELKQDATGSRTATWPATVSWAGGTAPTLTVTAGATDVVRFTWNATAAKYRGETVGKAFA